VARNGGLLPITAAAAVRSVEKVLSEQQVGVLTPGVAFGADFVLEIPETKRADSLEYVSSHPEAE